MSVRVPADTYLNAPDNDDGHDEDNNSANNK
jgi:hypothetical protein